MSDKPSASKPSQWACRTKREADAMCAWVNAEMDRLFINPGIRKAAQRLP